MELRDVFGAGGLLEKKIGNFRARGQQLEMAQGVAAACEDDGVAIFEAGTGTGKTFAYLAPLLLSKVRVVVSTSTRGLQEQLCGKDIPELKKALGIEADVRLLKGRRNYVCKRRLAQHLQQRELGFEGDWRGLVRKDLEAVGLFAKDSEDGDLAMLKNVPGHSQVWPMVTSTVDNCAAAKCPDYSSCFVYKARRRARAAQVLIVNHSLLLSDAQLRERGMGEVIPNYDVLVCDEAHEIPEMILQYFSLYCGSEETSRYAGELIEAAAVAGIADETDMQRVLGRIHRSAAEMRGNCDSSWWGTVVAAKALYCEKFRESATTLRDSFATLAEIASKLAVGDEDYASIERWAAERLAIFQELLEPASDAACWIEVGKTSVAVRKTPLNTDEIFRNAVLSNRKVVFTSATLGVDGCFDMFRRRLGIEEARENVWGSPFNYEDNTRLLLPPGMPDPRSDREQFVQTVCEIVVRLALANKGRAFALFATLADMRRAGETLADSLAGKCEVLVQGEKPADLLLRDFRARGRKAKLLVGTRTFWQGVDIPGQALSLVVIDRIPFQPPDDPLLGVLAASLDNPEDVFRMVQIPSAALLLKQAAGRLIRGERDCGVLVICDPRLRSMSYGKVIMRSLPPMPMAGGVDDAEEFLRAGRHVG